MKFNICNYLPINETIVYADKSVRHCLFSLPLVELSAMLNIKIKNLYRYRKGQRGIPLGIFLSIIKLMKLDPNKFQNKIQLKITKSGGYIRIGPFVEVDENWVYISEIIRGDGHIPKNLWSIWFINKEKLLIDHVKNFFLSKGVPPTAITTLRSRGVYQLIIRSKLMAHLFFSFFKIPIGAKAEMKIPNFIKDNKRLIIAAVRGAFDSEGTIQIGSKHHITPRRIVIASNSKKWLSDLKCILSRVNIESRIRADGRLYRLYITHQNNLKSFHKIIAPLHPKRKEKLKMLLETFSTTRIPERSMRKRILDAIKKGKTKRREIAHELKFPQQNLSWHLKWLKRNSMIKVTDRIYTNNGGCYIYGITKKGEKYLTNKFGAL